MNSKDRKIKVSIEIEDNWNRGDFRVFIKYLMSCDIEYELFIISNNDNASEITKVANIIGLDISHTIICNFTQDKIDAINYNHINIHFDNLQSFTLLVEETTEAYGILVSSNTNKFYAKKDYLVTFDIVLDEIRKINEKS